MGWTTPRTWSVGDLETAALFNSNIRDNLTFLYGGSSGNKPQFEAILSSQSIPNNTDTTVLFGTVVEDTASAYNTGTGVFTAPIGGLYLFTFGALWAGNGTGTRKAQLTLVSGSAMGTTYILASTDNGGQASVASVVRLGAGNTNWCTVSQTSGGALNLGVASDPRCRFTATWIGG